jgi:hypothetical protein
MLIKPLPAPVKCRTSSKTAAAVLGDLNDDEFAKAVAKTYAEVWKTQKRSADRHGSG